MVKEETVCTVKRQLHQPRQNDRNLRKTGQRIKKRWMTVRCTKKLRRDWLQTAETEGEGRAYRDSSLARQGNGSFHFKNARRTHFDL